MRLRTILLGAAAAIAASAPIVAQAAGRAEAPVAGENELGADENGVRLLVLALIAAVIVGGIALFDDEDDATSP